MTRPATRFLCDVMLARLARWLRAAGYDTRLAEETEQDRDILASAIAEGRLLLTRDQGFLEHKAAKDHALVLQSETIGAQAGELKRQLGVDWLRAPFTRCVMDNAVLRPAHAWEIPEVPPRVQKRHQGAVLACPVCGRVYWAGDHLRRMQSRLRGWARDP